MVWQANVAKFAAVLAFAVAGVVAFASLAITKEPTGPDGGDIDGISPAAVWIIRVAAGLLLLLVLGLFHEREALAEKLPKFPRAGWKRNVPLLVPLLVPLFLPVVHLAYALAVLAVGLWLLLTRVESLVGRLRGVAIFDGLLMLGLSLVMMRAGPANDYRIAQVLVSFYACAGAMLPGIALASSLAYSPGLTRLAKLSYGVAMLHAAAVVLQAVGNYAFQVFDGTDPVYTREQCFPQLDSFVGLFMASSATALTDTSVSKFDGPPNLPACPGEAWSGIPCDPIKWYVVLLACLGGLWLAAAAVLKTLWQQPVRVAPGEEQDAHLRRVKKRSMAKQIAAGALGLAFIGIIIPGWWVFWLCPDEGYRPEPAPAAAQPPAPPPAWWANSSTTTTSTRSTTSRTTTLTTVTTTTTDTTTSQTSTSSTVTSTTSTLTRTSTLQGFFGPVVQDNETAGPPNVTENVSLTPAPVCDERLPPMVDEAAASPPRPGCRCGEPIQAPLWAWTEVPAEQVASTWCELGNAAPVMCFMFLYCVHCYVWSLAGEQLLDYEIKEREIAFKRKQEKHRKKAMKKGVSVDQLVKAEKRAARIVLWEESAKEACPKPVAELGQDRLFNC